jgi:hypothetical protein
MLQGFYTADVHTITLTSATTEVYQSNPAVTTDVAHRGPVCVVSATVTGDGGTGTVEVEVGTWNDGTSTFTATQTIGYASAITGTTNADYIFKVIGNSNSATAGDAIQIVTTGSVVAFVRTQGLMVKVN